MARRTTCTTIDNAGSGAFDGVSTGMTVIAAAAFVFAAVYTLIFLITAAVATPATLIILGATIVAMATAAIITLVRIRNYFFDERLVCIQEDACAIGQMIVAEHNGDGDRSLNCVLAPADFDTTTAQDYQFNMWQSRELVYGDLNNDGIEDANLLSRGWNLNPVYNRSLDDEVFPKTWGLNELPLFHCEIEGTKFDKWIDALIGILTGYIVLGAGLIALGIFMTSNPAGWILWAVLAILAVLLFILSIFGLDLSNEDDEGSAEVSDLGVAVPDDEGIIIEDGAGTHVSNGDYIAFYGRHVVDTGHNPNCWNEIHPIRSITKISKEVYDNVGFESKGAVYERYCQALQDFHKEKGNVKIALTHMEHPEMG